MNTNSTSHNQYSSIENYSDELIEQSFDLKFLEPSLIGQELTSLPPGNKVNFQPISMEVSMTEVENQPWLNKDGSYKDEETIKAECKTWGPTGWEAYLTSIEVEPSEKEVIFENEDLSRELYSQKHKEIFEDCYSSRSFPELKVLLMKKVKELTHKQQKLIKATFWDQRSQVDLAEELDCSKASVSRMRDRALKRLAVLMLENVFELPNRNSQKANLKKEGVNNVNFPPISKGA